MYQMISTRTGKICEKSERFCNVDDKLDLRHDLSGISISREVEDFFFKQETKSEGLL